MLAMEKAKTVELAVNGMSYKEIFAFFRGDISLSTISQWLTDARRRGVNIPNYTAPLAPKRPRPSRPHRKITADPPKPKPKVEPLTAAEEARLADLAKRDIGLTAIAAQMRKPYAMLAEAMQRLGLARANVKLSTRAL